MPNMKKEDIRTVLLKWFDSSNRTLTKPQLEAVLEALMRCPLPLFLKLTFDYALKYVLTSYYSMILLLLGPTRINFIDFRDSTF